MAAQPVVSFVFQLAEAEYELCENIGEMDAEDVEETDSENEENKDFFLNILSTSTSLISGLLVFNPQKNMMGHILDVPFSPPDKF